MRKIVRITALTLLLVMLFSACASTTPSSTDNYIDVYHIINDDAVITGAIVRSERVKAGSDAISSAIKYLNGGPESNDLQKAIPDNCKIIEHWLTPDGELILSMEKGYLELSGIQKSIADYCLALTFCSLRNIETVSISVDGIRVSSGLLASDALLYDSEETPYEKQLNLYFADVGGRYLDIELRTLTVSDEISLERCVMEELLRGCYSSDLRNAIPAGTRLLSVRTELGVCTVDLSQDFVTNKPTSILDCRLAIYSIVNSLCTLSDVDAVQILIEGRLVREYGYQLLALPLIKNDDLVTPAMAGRGEKDIDVYLSLASPDFLTPIPAKINNSGYASDAWALADKLLNHTSEPSFRQLFPPYDIEFEIRELDRICFINLYAEDIEWCNSQGTGYLAAQSIIATLGQLKSVDRVSIGCLDGTSTFNGLKPAVRYTPYNAIIIK